MKALKQSVGLQEITKRAYFYNLAGSDNIELFYTERYPNKPFNLFKELVLGRL